MAKLDNQKLTGKESPCKAPEPCLDHRDYDPCETGEDITDNDLEMLLKEEQARLRREKDKERAEEAGRESEGGEGKGWNEDGKGKDGDGEGGKAGGATAGRGRPCHRGKKPPCRKVPETNPFFMDRLGFWSDLPPPPPIPPPQFFPPVDGSEAKVCPKRRKKCKKGSRGKGKEGHADGTGKGKGMGAAATASGGPSSEKMDAGGVDEGECKCQYEDECKEDGSYMGERKIVKGRCKKKPRDRPPCRKKVSEVSISLQPRHIPALQRDLPPTSPKDIPEVVRQILMACGNECSVDCGRRRCKKAERCK